MTPSMLTKRQLQVLRIMQDNADNEDGELVYERGVGYLGLDRIAPRTLFALLRVCAISADSFQSGDAERYHINGTGKQILEGDSTI
jgi:hypothetical protein